jgi:hypothetical protein
MWSCQVTMPRFVAADDGYVDERVVTRWTLRCRRGALNDYGQMRVQALDVDAHGLALTSAGLCSQLRHLTSGCGTRTDAAVISRRHDDSNGLAGAAQTVSAHVVGQSTVRLLRPLPSPLAQLQQKQDEEKYKKDG